MLTLLLTIASRAIAVLPVPLSPTISSLCPLPIGTSASTAIIPVCSASWTDLRWTTPGDIPSTCRTPVPTIGGPPSRGSHVVLKTLPKKSSPTRTEAISPVLLTVSLVSICLSIFPRLTIPASSASRVTASPFSPLSNSTISPALKEVSP